MQCSAGHVMPFNPDSPEGFDCIYCEEQQMPSAKDLLSVTSLKFVKETRPGQIALAAAVSQDIQNQNASAYEAGTGVGKSFAYLLPAIISGKRVVISTAKIALQNQLMEKDLPYIQSELYRLNHPRKDFKFFAAYGRGNYACHALYMKEKDTDRVSLQVYNNFYANTEYQRFDEWSTGQGYLDRGLNASTCVGPSCSFFRTCGYQRARREVHQSNIVVTNNWLLGYHLRLTQANNFSNLLGKYDHVIVDEGHKVEDGIRAAYTNETKLDTVLKLKKQISKLEALTMDSLDVPALKALSGVWEPAFSALAANAQTQGTLLAPQTKTALDRVTRTLDDIRDWALDVSFLSKIFPNTGTAVEVQQHLAEKYAPSTAQGTQIPAAPISLSDASQKRMLDLDIFFSQLSNAQETFHNIAAENPFRTWVYDPAPHTGAAPVLKSIPITIGHYMPKSCVTYLSATLALGNSFDNFLQRVGINKVPHQTKIFPSPFDIQKQAFLYIPYPGSTPGRIPPPVNTAGPGREAYLEAVASHVHELLLASEGDAFVLFTAKTELAFVHEYLKSQAYHFPIFAQGEFPPAEALQRFRSTPKSTILGLKSFWEGVDVQGDKLFLVIITKLPFPNTSDPIYQARCNLVNKTAPGCSEQLIRLPDMLFDLRQGVGRLIRAQTDRGVIAILDTRAHLRYREAVRATLGLREHVELDKMCRAIRTRHSKKNAAE